MGAENMQLYQNLESDISTTAVLSYGAVMFDLFRVLYTCLCYICKKVKIVISYGAVVFIQGFWLSSQSSYIWEVHTLNPGLRLAVLTEDFIILWRIHPLLSGDSVNNYRFLATAR
jgi:hypothetical protein